jgi:hypothetical protein
MTDHFARPDAPATSNSRRLIAGGFVRRTTANARIAERHRLLRLCREDYKSNADRRVQGHRNDAFLIAVVAETPRGGDCR